MNTAEIRFFGPKIDIIIEIWFFRGRGSRMKGSEIMQLTHAGGVAFRKKGNQFSYLVISSSDGAHWVLPKGHIETGEGPEETALRELREEAGIIGEIVTELSTHQYKKEDEVINVRYFLIRHIGYGHPKENRSVQWVNEHGALQLLSFEDARKALRMAAKVASNDENTK
jgi:8-oxo-dGTP pyrophosphatase MutT (NUDIX family)